MKASRNNRILLLIIMLAAIIFANTACKSELVQEKAASYFPSSQGSLWKYKGEGNEYATFSRTVVFTENNKAQFKEDNGGTVSMSIYQISNDQVKRIFFRGESYENKKLFGEKANDNTILLKTPLTVNNTWSTDKEKREITAINATVTVPAGTFKNCLKVKISPIPSSSQPVTYEYYAKNIGLVKREYTSDNMSISSSLEEYQIK